MLDIKKTLSRLTERHQEALRWFVAYKDQERSWPGSLPDGTLLASKAKGIYKPGWSNYALSVRQSLGGPYLDRDPTLRSDGTWSYDYFQENTDPDQRDSEYTNLGLVHCMEDNVPVGVFRQVAKRPARYRILGLAVVVGWVAGYFHLEGYSEDGIAHERRAQAEIDVLIEFNENAISYEEEDYESSEVGRDRIVASVVRRRGQPEFRRRLIEAYGGRCASSGCDAEAALEACHIRPYMGPKTNTLSNGILLRADLHTLFDLGLFTIDTVSMTAVVAPELKGTTYSEFAGKPIGLPRAIPGESNIEGLDWHRRWTGLSGKGNLQ